MLCVQETKWKGDRAREIGEGYRLIYCGTETRRNGVGIICNEHEKENVMEVKRCSGHCMMLKLATGEGIINIVSAYAPQSGCSDEEKVRFYEELESLLRGLPEEERVVLGADLNGHVGEENASFEGSHGGKGYGVRNAEGVRVLEMAEECNFILANTLFTKKEEHLITFKSGGNKSQIDYIAVRRANRAEVINCKVIPGEPAVKQHRLLVVDLRVQRKKTRRKHRGGKIKVWKLRDEEIAAKYKVEVKKRKDNLMPIESVEDAWSQLKTVVIDQTERLCGRTRGMRPTTKEEWWWTVEVQEAIKKKKEAFKDVQRNNSQEANAAYKTIKRETKRVVARPKAAAADEFYQKLESKEGEQRVYKIAKARERERAKRDTGDCVVVKSKTGALLIEDRDICKRWKEYFEELLNTENTRDELEVAEQVEGPEMNIQKEEVEAALKAMKRGKAAGPTEIQAEAIIALGECGVDWLLEIFNKGWDSETIPKDWELSTLIPMFKNKGNTAECGNY